jgi:hypothetical protein
MPVTYSLSTSVSFLQLCRSQADRVKSRIERIPPQRMRRQNLNDFGDSLPDAPGPLIIVAVRGIQQTVTVIL